MWLVKIRRRSYPDTDRLLAELKFMTDTIPHDQLAIQWDVAVEVGVVEREFPTGFRC
jgi:hypothetical protein